MGVKRGLLVFRKPFVSSVSVSLESSDRQTDETSVEEAEELGLCSQEINAHSIIVIDCEKILSGS